MSERNPNRKRDSEFEASSVSISPLKKTKLDDSSSGTRDVAFGDSSSSPSSVSVASSDSGECSVTSAGEYEEQSSSNCPGCFNRETSGIATNSSTIVIDPEAHRISQTETSTFVAGNSREEREGESTEMELSLATENDDGRSPMPDEIEEFFSELENEDKQKQFNFIEKYNFDIVNDEPLHGRYRWDRFNLKQ